MKKTRTIDGIDILLKNRPIPFPLHLCQTDININLLLYTSHEHASSNIRDAGHSLGKRLLSTSDLTLLNKKGRRILCSASTTFLLFSSSASPSFPSLCKKLSKSA